MSLDTVPPGRLPDHLVDLPDGWALWRTMVVRAAGFPARGVLDLADVDAAALADRLNELDATAAARRLTAIRELEAAVPAGHPLDKPAGKLLKRLKRGELGDVTPELAAAAPALLALPSLDADRADARARLADAYAAGLRRATAALRTWAADPRFREAVTWQNPRAIATALDRLVAAAAAPPTVSNSKDRQHEQLVASYLQRYCVKNDTIGFFGPVGWGNVSGQAATLVEPGPSLLRTRLVFLEQWAIDLLGASLASDRALRIHLPPRLMPSVAVDGTTLRYGFGRTAQLPAHLASLLRACDGETPAREIARTLLEAHALDDASAPEDVYDLLDGLVEKKLITWTLEPRAYTHSDRELRRLLERIGDPAIREPAIAALARLETARDQVAAASGAEALARALTHLDATFQDITGSAATRRGGETYAARTILYEDCVRDLDVALGQRVLDRLAPPLHLVNLSARWFTYELATRVKDAAIAHFRTLRAATTGPVRYLSFVKAIDELVPGGPPTVIGAAMEDELERRWSALLDIDMSSRRVDLSAAALRDRAAQLFAAPRSGWPSARHIAPDVMIAARGVEALDRGDFLVVLGEVHVGNTLMSKLFAPLQPAGEDLAHTYESDIAATQIMSVPPGTHIHRALNMPWVARDLDLETGASRSWRPRTNVVRAADLVVEEHGETVVVRDLASGRCFDLLTILEQNLLDLAQSHYKPAPRGTHVPRITIDGVVFTREMWRLQAAELPTFDAEPRSPTAFAQVRAWAATLGLPRWVFFKIPEEPKPVFLDLTSPVFVEMFLKLVRKASRLTISEMLPSVEDTWVPDAAGNLYTSELRLVAVDPHPCQLEPGLSTP